MEIINSTVADIPAMLHVYDMAREYQKEKSLNHWLSFDPELIKKEIEENRQWKILEEGNLACIFMTAFDEPYIWGEMNKDPSIYIHRIATHPRYRGNHYVLKIIDWAKEYAAMTGKQFIRMDTWGDNVQLTNYYITCGFSLTGIFTPESPKMLPEHYNCISISLLEIKIE
jgi:ribosomal protein S18 acetylase RimI-like enzyme